MEETRNNNRTDREGTHDNVTGNGVYDDENDIGEDFGNPLREQGAKGGAAGGPFGSEIDTANEASAEDIGADTFGDSVTAGTDHGLAGTWAGGDSTANSSGV